MAAHKLVVGQVEVLALTDHAGDLPISVSEVFPDVPADSWAPFRQRQPELFSGPNTWHNHYGNVSILSEALSGVWELQRWETVLDDEIIGYPLGEEAFGLLIYHPGGFMSVNISSSTRSPSHRTIRSRATRTLLALDAQGLLSYCGPFSIESEHEVIHHLKLYSFEDWVGTDQHRFAQLEGDTLTLSTAPRLLRGKQGVGRLVWKRVTTTG